MALHIGPYHYTVIPAAILLALLAYTSLEAIRGRLGKARKLYALAALAAATAWIIYTVPYVTRDFTLKPVYETSSVGLPWWLLPATAWSTGGGSLFLFAVVAAIGGWLVARSVEHRLYTAVAPWLSGIVVISAWLYGAFDYNPAPVGTGIGLNPLLKSIWIYPHPLTTFGGYALLAVSAFALALGLRSKSITIVYEVGWALLTIGIMLGGLWSYETFGWGGYWAWDPVETSELMVWLAATTLPHVLVAATPLTAPTALLTTSTVYLAMFVTRGGLSALHSFAAPDIASIILLYVSIAMLIYALYRLAFTDYHALYRQVRGWLAKPFNLGLGVATIALGIATVFVTATLLNASILAALGKQVSVPQMDAGIQYFHPILYPVALALLAGITVTFLGDRLGWRGVTALITAAGIVAALYAYQAYETKMLAPLSPPETNAMMAAGTVFAALAITATAVYLALRAWDAVKRHAPSLLARDAYTGIALIHLGFALVLLGVFLGGTYSYNQSYAVTYVLKPGDSIILPSGQKLVFESYEYGMTWSPVDIYTFYVGRSLTYIAAQDALFTLHADIADIYSNYVKALRLLRQPPYNIIPTLLRKASIGAGAVTLCPSPCNGTIGYRDLATNMTGTMTVTGLRIELDNVSFSFALEPWQHQGVLSAVLSVYVNATNATLYGRGVAALPLGSHMIYLVTLDEPQNVTLSGVGVLEVRSISFIVTPEALRQRIAGPRGNNTLVLGPIFGYIVDGVLYAREGVLPVGLSKPLPTPLAYYLMVNGTPFEQLLREINETSLGLLLENPPALLQLVNTTKCPVGYTLLFANPTPVKVCRGFVAAPHYAPENSYLRLKFRVESPSGTATMEALIRFEVNGEIAGIHGSVPKVLHSSIGPIDVYITVNQPLVYFNYTFTLPDGSPYTPSFPDLVVYYLHEAFKKIRDPRERLALAALLAAGLQVDNVRKVLRSGNPHLYQLITTMLELDTVSLYLLAEKYNVTTPTVAVKGVDVDVKLVPGAVFVWGGSVLMSLAAVLAAAARLAAGRRQG